ncbi:hypothetical protein CRENBAI_000800 [Crenichthys baileyi]|uniref:Uncharacterized protein n=1 Tax=Crenichthys baileyi TaxID=28760 RepID=A0AAV9R012_9TELE
MLQHQSQLEVTQTPQCQRHQHPSPSASAIYEGSADIPAYVSTGGQPDVPAPVSSGDQPYIPASFSAIPDEPPATAAQLFLPTHFLGFLWGILSEIFGVPAPASAVGRRDASAPADQPSSQLKVGQLLQSKFQSFERGSRMNRLRPEFREGFMDEPPPSRVPRGIQGRTASTQASRALVCY